MAPDDSQGQLLGLCPVADAVTSVNMHDVIPGPRSLPRGRPASGLTVPRLNSPGLPFSGNSPGCAQTTQNHALTHSRQGITRASALFTCKKPSCAREFLSAALLGHCGTKLDAQMRCHGSQDVQYDRIRHFHHSRPQIRITLDEIGRVSGIIAAD